MESEYGFDHPVGSDPYLGLEFTKKDEDWFPPFYRCLDFPAGRAGMLLSRTQEWRDQEEKKRNEEKDAEQESREIFMPGDYNRRDLHVFYGKDGVDMVSAHEYNRLMRAGAGVKREDERVPLPPKRVKQEPEKFEESVSTVDDIPDEPFGEFGPPFATATATATSQSQQKSSQTPPPPPASEKAAPVKNMVAWEHPPRVKAEKNDDYDAAKSSSRIPIHNSDDIAPDSSPRRPSSTSTTPSSSSSSIPLVATIPGKPGLDKGSFNKYRIIPPDGKSRRRICRFFKSSSCTRGDGCIFSHNLKDMPCEFILKKGNCWKGNSCVYDHSSLNADEKEFWKDYLSLTSEEMEDYLGKKKEGYKSSSSMIEDSVNTIPLGWRKRQSRDDSVVPSSEDLSSSVQSVMNWAKVKLEK